MILAICLNPYFWTSSTPSLLWLSLKILHIWIYNFDFHLFFIFHRKWRITYVVFSVVILAPSMFSRHFHLIRIRCHTYIFLIIPLLSSSTRIRRKDLLLCIYILYKVDSKSNQWSEINAIFSLPLQPFFQRAFLFPCNGPPMRQIGSHKCHVYI